MKPKEKKPEIVYRVFDNHSKEEVGAYSRSYCTEYDFTSIEEARSSNVHGIYLDQHRYKIRKYKVTYELVEGDL